MNQTVVLAPHGGMRIAVRIDNEWVDLGHITDLEVEIEYENIEPYIEAYINANTLQQARGPKYSVSLDIESNREAVNILANEASRIFDGYNSEGEPIRLSEGYMRYVPPPTEDTEGYVRPHP